MSGNGGEYDVGGWAHAARRGARPGRRRSPTGAVCGRWASALKFLLRFAHAVDTL